MLRSTHCGILNQNVKERESFWGGIAMVPSLKAMIIFVCGVAVNACVFIVYLLFHVLLDLSDAIDCLSFSEDVRTFAVPFGARSDHVLL